MKTISLFTSLTIGILLLPAAYAKPAAVDLKDCSHMANTTSPFVLIIQRLRILLLILKINRRLPRSKVIMN